MKRKKKTIIKILLSLLILISGCKNADGSRNPEKDLTVDYATIPYQEYKALQIADAREKFDLLFQALEQFYQEQGYYPYFLSQLTPEYLGEIPRVLDRVTISYSRAGKGDMCQLSFYVDEQTPNNDCAHSWCGQIAGEEFICEFFQDDVCKNAEP